jgi:hypothetical protein
VRDSRSREIRQPPNVPSEFGVNSIPHRELPIESLTPRAHRPAASQAASQGNREDREGLRERNGDVIKGDGFHVADGQIIDYPELVAEVEKYGWDIPGIQSRRSTVYAVDSSHYPHGEQNGGQNEHGDHRRGDSEAKMPHRWPPSIVPGAGVQNHRFRRLARQSNR